MTSDSVSPKTAGWAAWILGSALALWVLSGCNLFAPLAADDSGDLNYRGLILKGSEAINDRDYAGAAGYFKRAMALNPRGSEAYLFHSKAIISQYGVDYSELNLNFECKRQTRNLARCQEEKIDTNGVPFVDSTTTVEGIDSVYYPVATAVRNLEHILRKSKDTIALGGPWKMYPDGDTASDGRVSDGVARLDLGLLQAVKAMLAPLDLDGSDRIDRVCGLNLCAAGDDACRLRAPYTQKCKEGAASEINRLESFKKLTKRVSLDNLDSKDVNARNVSTNPNDINSFLDAMQGPVAGSSFNLDSVTGAMKSHNEQKMSDQLEGIVSNITDLNNFLSYMRYNDSVDNDWDHRSGRLERDSIMAWHDYDKDGGIRHDYDDNARFTGWPAGSYNLGHPVHRHLYKGTLYKTFAEWAQVRAEIGADTSKNSRKALMIKHCRDVTEKLAVEGALTAPIKAQIHAEVCSTYTTLLKPGVNPPARSDWVGGTPFVDEEMVDERDNDHDGLKDEDARNARRMDDDDDALVNLGMIGNRSAVAPMIWADDPASANKCPDIVKGSMPAPPYQRQFCIGSLEHRIHLVKTFMAPGDANAAMDSMKTYYSRFIENELAPNANCLEDYEKLPKEYRDAVQLQVTDPVVRVACRFKHIWIKPIPPNSEWTSGVFGIDEEILDGVDNDGDGWIDEDLR